MRNNNYKEERQKFIEACEVFNCEPWIAIYVETSDTADLYLISLENYDNKYRKEGKFVDVWRMEEIYKEIYKKDPNIKHIRFEFYGLNWNW